MELELITQIPKDNPRPTPVLFIHGSWHGAWCWENFLPFFADRGYRSYALSLRGHGNSAGKEGIRWYSAVHDYVADVEQIVNTFDTPPVIVGHSMGGYILQKYLEERTAAAGVLLASIPVSGIYRFALRLIRHHLGSFLKAHLLLNPWHIVAKPELAHDAFFSRDMPQEEVARHFARLQPESFWMELEALFLRLPRPEKVKTPLLVLAAANDRAFSVAEQQATARAYHTEAEVFPDMAHDMMLERGWQSVANRIVDWLQGRGL